MLPVIIFAVILVPLIAYAFVSVRRRTNAAEHPAGETAADRARNEQEFAAAEQYQAELREAQHGHAHDTPPQ